MNVRRKRQHGTVSATAIAEVDALYRGHAKALLVFLARRTADPQIALDLWGETFALALEDHDARRGTSEAEAQAWLYAIARRQLAQFYRRGRIEQAAMRRLQLERPPASPEVLADLERTAGLQQVRGELRAALTQLSPAVREAVRLRIVDELPYPELARRLGVAEPAARARVSRGLAALADLLDPCTPEVMST